LWFENQSKAFQIELSSFQRYFVPLTTATLDSSILQTSPYCLVHNYIHITLNRIPKFFMYFTNYFNLIFQSLVFISSLVFGVIRCIQIYTIFQYIFRNNLLLNIDLVSYHVQINCGLSYFVQILINSYLTVN
jgi:hypothetical protein